MVKAVIQFDILGVTQIQTCEHCFETFVDRGFHLLRDDRYGWMGLNVENWEKKITRSGGSIPRCSYVSHTGEQGGGTAS